MGFSASSGNLWRVLALPLFWRHCVVGVHVASRSVPARRYASLCSMTGRAIWSASGSRSSKRVTLTTRPSRRTRSRATGPGLERWSGCRSRLTDARDRFSKGGNVWVSTESDRGLGHGIVPAVGTSAHAGFEVVGLTEPLEVVTAILAALIGVHDDAAGRLPAPDRHQQRIHGQLPGETGLHRPADNLACEQVDDDCQVSQPCQVLT